MILVIILSFHCVAMCWIEFFMSLDYVGFCYLEIEDPDYAIYSYRGEDWNLKPEVREQLEHIKGSFTIAKSCLEEPEIHRRVKKTPKGKKKFVEKIIVHTPDINAHIASGDVVIDNLCGVDMIRNKSSFSRPSIVHSLLDKVFISYQECGHLPDEVCFIR